jgi:malate synthase
MSATKRVSRGKLSVAAELDDLVSQRIAPGTGVDAEAFWAGFESIVDDLAPRNRALLARRDELQATIDEWHEDRRGRPLDAQEYRAFLEQIGYLVPEPAPFKILTADVDDEIARIAGPQLVVPVMNARYALNAANARWGSLYDALYGTDVLPEEPGREKGTSYNPARGELVVERAARFLDETVPLAGASHSEVIAYGIGDGPGGRRLRAILDNGGNTRREGRGARVRRDHHSGLRGLCGRRGRRGQVRGLRELARADEGRSRGSDGQGWARRHAPAQS